ncbi:MAG: Gfo/Idh/MocA family oxidoreductase [Terricaulis sp.]
MAPLRIGILGTARIARDFCTGVRGSEKVAVVAIASREAEKAESFAREFAIERAHGSYEALVADDDVDAIYNPLPNSLHAPWSIRAAEAGKHVLCEKPLALNEGEVHAIFAAAARNEVHIREAYPYLSQPQTLKLQELVADGAIGRVQLVRASFGFTLDDPVNIRWAPEMGGGALLDAGSYPVSLVRALAGAAPTRVTAAATWTESGVDRTLAATLEHASGLIAQISCSFATGDHRHALIAGDGGVIETNYWNHTTPERPAIVSLRRGARNRGGYEAIEVEQMNGFRAEAEAFADLIAGKEWRGATPAQSVDIAHALDAILASARLRSPVDLQG